MKNEQQFEQRFADWAGFETLNDPELLKAVRGCVEWYQAFKNGESPRWLTLTGKSGVGKTHLVSRLFRWSNSKSEKQNWGLSYIPHVVYWPDFVQKLRAGESFAKREDMKKWRVLCLDDIGSERDTTGFAAEELNTLLGCRTGMWTLLTSNLGIDEFGQIDQRISSRLIREKNICIHLKTKDFAAR